MNLQPLGIDEERLEVRILNAFRAGILAIDAEGKVLLVNKIGLKILDQYPVTIGEDLRGRTGENVFFRLLVESLSLKYLPARVDVELGDRDGGRRYIGFTLSELRENSRRFGICAFFKDLTNVEITEENRSLNKRLLLLGQMAAELAHEIRNPIAGIGVHCGLIGSRCKDDPKIKSSVIHIEREINKVENIIRECLDFVRPAELKIQPTRIIPLLERIVTRAGKIHGGVFFEFFGEGTGDPVPEIDENLMEQALMNIVTNAAQACEGQGRVTIRCRLTKGYWSTPPDKGDILVANIPGEQEEYLTISIRDTGGGVPEEIREKIFVLFFTTKKAGTGIGLPLVQKIVYAHKGVLDILSEPGKGTEVIIKIPMRQSHG